jgi:hypothetical protein
MEILKKFALCVTVFFGVLGLAACDTSSGTTPPPPTDDAPITQTTPDEDADEEDDGEDSEETDDEDDSDAGESDGDGGESDSDEVDDENDGDESDEDDSDEKEPSGAVEEEDDNTDEGDIDTEGGNETGGNDTDENGEGESVENENEDTETDEGETGSVTEEVPDWNVIFENLYLAEFEKINKLGTIYGTIEEYNIEVDNDESILGKWKETHDGKQYSNKNITNSAILKMIADGARDLMLHHYDFVIGNMNFEKFDEYETMYGISYEAEYKTYYENIITGLLNKGCADLLKMLE